MTKKLPTGDDGYTGRASANELGNAARSAVESLLGRKVADEEQVTVMAYPAARPAEGEPDRKGAARDLIEDLDSMAASAGNIPEEEMDQLIDEAIRHVRHRRT